MTQALLMGSVTAVISIMLLLLVFLDSPFRSGVGASATDGDGAIAADRRRGARRAGRERRRPADSVRRRRPAAVSRDGGGARVDWVDVARRPLLALATVATAWSGYQASRWNGEQAKAGARANAARIESSRAAGLANAQTQVDVATFIAVGRRVRAPGRATRRLLLRPVQNGVQARGRGLGRDEASEEPERAADAVRDAPVPARGADEGGHPRRRIGARWRPARARTSSAPRTTSSASFSSPTALFFAGMSAKLPSRRLRIVLLCLGVAVFVGAVAWIASSPVSVSV